METMKKALVDIVGAEFVIDDPVILDKYAADRSLRAKAKTVVCGSSADRRAGSGACGMGQPDRNTA